MRLLAFLCKKVLSEHSVCCNALTFTLTPNKTDIDTGSLGSASWVLLSIPPSYEPAANGFDRINLNKQIEMNDLVAIGIDKLGHRKVIVANSAQEHVVNLRTRNFGL